MKYRWFAWIVVVSAVVFMLLGVAEAGAASGGRVKGRMTVDGKPVVAEKVSLSGGGSTGGPETTTDGNGRFVFESVPPGRYKLDTGLSLSVGQQSAAKCKVPGYAVLSLPLTGTSQGNVIIASVESQRAFQVKAGKTVKRDIKMDCKTDVVVLPSPTSTP